MNTDNLTTLDSFTAAYIQTALWSSNDEDGEPLDRNYSVRDIESLTMDKMIADCARFQKEQHEVIQSAIDTGFVKCGPDFDEWGRAGHDFWLTRVGHGAGFWDGDWPSPQDDMLTDASKAFGNVDLFVGDDGKIYQTP